MGNLGGASVVCAQVPLNVENASINFSCKTGVLNTKVMQYSNPDKLAFSTGIINAS